jgi:hypothetical protein
MNKFSNVHKRGGRGEGKNKRKEKGIMNRFGNVHKRGEIPPPPKKKKL